MMHNFDLRLTQLPGGDLGVSVTASPAGEGTPLRAPWPEVGPVTAARASEQERLGAGLAAALAGVWPLWREALGHAGGDGLRLRLHTDAAAAALPWELLADAERGVFLARDPLTPVVRYLQGPIALLPFAAQAQATLLLTGAAPQGLPPTHSAESLAAIQAIVQGSPLRPAPPEAHLRSQQLAAMVTVQRPAVVHFHGHASWDAQRQEGFLVLEDARGAAVRLPAAMLAATLRSQGVQLVVLAACAGVDEGAAPWRGLAQALVQAGIPAVLAMAGAVRTEVADAVMAAFYGALAAGRPYDVAANLARNVAALAALDTPQPGAWVQPQLLMRSPHALLWQPDASAMPAPLRRWRDGGLFVQNLYAGAVINAETVSSTIDIRGAQIGPGRAGGDPAAADPAAADQQRQLVEGQKKLQEQVAQMLAGQQVQNEALDVIRRQQLNELDLNTVLAGLQEVFVEVQRHNDLLLAASEAMDLAQVEAGLAESGLGVKQRFKLTLPLLLWFLSYEAEFEWDGRVDLQAALDRVMGQAPSATSARSG